MGIMSLIQFAEEQGAEVERQKTERKRIKEIEEKKLQEQLEQIKLLEEIEQQKIMFQKILSHRRIIDLHGFNIQGARSIVGAKANEIIRSESMLCYGFIHGVGNNSGPAPDTYEFWHASDEEFEPKLKPNIRKYLDNLASKNSGCKSIYGEHMFPIQYFRYEGDSVTESLCSGITYFMNQLFYEYYYNDYNYYWSIDDILQFQSLRYSGNKSVTKKLRGR